MCCANTQQFGHNLVNIRQQSTPTGAAPSQIDATLQAVSTLTFLNQPVQANWLVEHTHEQLFCKYSQGLGKCTKLEQTDRPVWRLTPARSTAPRSLHQGKIVF